MAHTKKRLSVLREIASVLYRMPNEPQSYRAFLFTYGFVDYICDFPKPKHIALRFLRSKGWRVNESRVIITKCKTEEYSPSQQPVLDCFIAIECKKPPLSLRLKIASAAFFIQLVSFFKN